MSYNFTINPNWSEIYNDISKTLSLIGIPVHVGSTSIPNLIAKDVIDIVLIVSKLSDCKLLSSLGYKFKGEYNVPLRFLYAPVQNALSDKYFQDVHIHCCEADHPFVSLQLAFKNYLLNNPAVIKQYHSFKKHLLEDKNIFAKKPNQMFTNYTLGKHEFIQNIISKSGWSEYIVNFCTHEQEWNYFNTHIAKNRYNFVFYKGVDLIGCMSMSASYEIVESFNYDDIYKKWIARWLQSELSKI